MNPRPRQKLKDSDYKDIRTLSGRIPTKKIAEIFDISITHARRIIEIGNRL